MGAVSTKSVLATRDCRLKAQGGPRADNLAELRRLCRLKALEQVQAWAWAQAWTWTWAWAGRGRGVGAASAALRFVTRLLPGLTNGLPSNYTYQQ